MKIKFILVSIVIVFSAISFLSSLEANAQVKLDISSETARQAVGQTDLDDLAVHDTAFIYGSFCIKDNGLYVPGWTVPADLANNQYAATGVILHIEILAGKKLKGNFVDAAQAQQKAQGKDANVSLLAKEDYNKAVKSEINNLFSGGVFGTNTCDNEQKNSPLRTMNLYSVDSINGYTKLSELLASVK